MIHYEHYVSFETAKKLESIDFPQNSVECFYRDNGHIYKRNHYNLKEICELAFKSNESYDAPSLALAINYLYQSWGIYVEVSFGGEKYYVDLVNIKDNTSNTIEPKLFNTPEEAQEYGISEACEVIKKEFKKYKLYKTSQSPLPKVRGLCKGG